MVAVVQPRTASSDRVVYRTRSLSPLQLIQGSLSTRKVARQFPLLAGIHKASDGALVGVLVAVTLMSTLTLHWQHLWTNAFKKLETTRTLASRLTESTAMLESHLLQKTNFPKSMVPTKVANLVYLQHPVSKSSPNEFSELLLKSLVKQPIHHGY